MIEQDRVISAGPQREEEAYDRAVRPKSLADYVGQAAMKAQMEIFIQAARQRGEALDHVLIFGPPGLGKTTLAHVIANELGVGFKQTSGPVLERPGDLAALLTNLQPNEILFVDEIHRLSPVVEEILYPALEDFQLDIVIGEGPGARSIKIDLPPFTLVGATTRAGMLTNPLRDRFGIVARLEFYSPAELTRIVTRSAGLFRKLREKQWSYNDSTAVANRELMDSDAETVLLGELMRFPEIIESAAVNRGPQILANYLRETANAFHSFYENCDILSEDEALRSTRLGLCKATAQVLSNGLALLGVSAPERM